MAPRESAFTQLAVEERLGAHHVVYPTQRPIARDHRRFRTLKIVEASDSSLLVVLGDAISEKVQERVISLFHALAKLRDPRIRNLHPAYASLLIDFDPRESSHNELAKLAEELARTRRPGQERKPRIVEIPACYDAAFAPDLLDIAKHTKKSPEEVIALHSSATYHVCFLGFSPGFAYLSGLPEALQVPRLDTPRKSVKAGTVAIAGSQAAVYPVDSPGGWRLIGRTPVQMFNPAAIPASRLTPGDVVKFAPIDRGQFETMSRTISEKLSNRMSGAKPPR